MGTTFRNIQVKVNKGMLANHYLAESEVQIRFSEEWVTILGEDNEFNTSLLRAMQISEVMNEPVLHVHYLEKKKSGVLKMTLIEQGKKMGYFEVTEQGALLHKAREWEQALELSKEEMKLLRFVAKEEKNARKVLAILSALLGAKLHVDRSTADGIIMETLCEIEELPQVKKDKEFLSRYEEKMRKHGHIGLF